MMLFEYKVVPAPERGKKLRGARSAPDRFASTLESLMNELAQDGWEYHRAETLPSEERAGLTGRTTVYRNLLIFRRPDPSGAMRAPPEMLEEGAAEPQDQKEEPPRKTEAQRARSAGLRAILPAALTAKAQEPAVTEETAPQAPTPEVPSAPPSAEEAAAAAAAAALRSVKPPEKKPAAETLAGEKPGLVSLMADKRASRPAK